MVSSFSKSSSSISYFICCCSSIMLVINMMMKRLPPLTRVLFCILLLIFTILINHKSYSQQQTFPPSTSSSTLLSLKLSKNQTNNYDMINENEWIHINQQQQQHHKIVKRQIGNGNIIKLQRFLVEPENITVNIGESVILPCRVSNKAGTVQWTRDGFGLGADPRLDGFPTYSMIHNDATGDYSLKISSVTLDDDAIFQCQVGALDNVPGIRSQNAKLTVRVQPDDPVIVLGNINSNNHNNNNNFLATNNFNPVVSSNYHHQDLSIPVLSTTAGNKIELTCEAHGGRPAAELSWINSRNRVVKKGITSKITPMSDGKRYNSALKWVFEPTKSDHLKKLTCRSSHPTLSNSSSASVMLEVKYAPEVKLEVSRIMNRQLQSPSNTPLMLMFGATNLHGRVGDTIKFKCSADGNPGNNSLIYQWLRNDEIILGDHGNELIVDNIDKTFNGAEIICKVTNPVGTGMASVTLNIAYGPSFQPSMEYVYSANPRDTIRLECKVDGNPAPDITWIKVGTSSVISSGSRLTIRNTNEESIGEYLCRVSVKGFPEISAIVYLRLNGPPKIRKRNSSNNFNAVLGEPGHLECLVESVPPPIAIAWIHNGQIFTSGSNSNIPINYDIHEESLKEEAVVLRASFDIRSTLQHDYGFYNCVVVNNFGSDWHIVSLDEKTSFSTIVIFVSISISILVFIVLTTIIFLLLMKHRKLMRKQREKEEQEQKDGDANNKEHYMNGNDGHIDTDNHNIYSTHSTRTNSSSDKNGPTETGTIITRSGGSTTNGSPRSSTSSFPAYLESTNVNNNNNNSPNHSRISIPSNHHRRSPHHQHHPHHHHHLHNIRSATGMFSSTETPSRSPYFINTVFDSNNDVPSSLVNPTPSKSPEIMAMPPINSSAYSTLTRRLASGFSPQPPPQSTSSLRNSYSPYIPQMYQQLDSLGMIVTSSNDMYQANPYQVLPSSSSSAAAASANQSALSTSPTTMVTARLKSISTPTPTPSLTKELDNCILSKNSIATHV